MRLGVIGSGFGLYGLLPAFKSIQGCEVVSVCGKQTERLVSYCSSVGVTSLYSDWEEMLRTEQLDALAIAVVPSAQYKIAKVALQKGLHIFAEKPLSANSKQAEELMVLAKQYNVVTAVDFIFPEIETWVEAKKIIDSGIYGRVCHISVVWNFLSFDIKNDITSWKTDIASGGGALSFFMSHTLHYLEYFVGTIVNVQSNFLYSKKSKNDGEVGVDLLLTFRDGVNGVVQMSCDSVGVQTHTVQLLCEKATLILESKKGVTDHFTLTIFEEGKEKKYTNKQHLLTNEDERVIVVKRIAARFVDAVLHNKKMSPSFIEGARVQYLIDQVRGTA